MTTTLVSLLLDMTGSMQTTKQATIDAYNEYAGALQLNPDTQSFLMSISVFNSLVGRERVAGPGPVTQMPLLSHERYKPDGVTPLYDAIADTIKEAESHAGPVLLVVLTDGQENASQRYKKGDVNKMIAERTQAGWQFVYLACDLDAMQEGADLGIPAGSTLSYSAGQAARQDHTHRLITSTLDTDRPEIRAEKLVRYVQHLESQGVLDDGRRRVVLWDQDPPPLPRVVSVRQLLRSAARLEAVEGETPRGTQKRILRDLMWGHSVDLRDPTTGSAPNPQGKGKETPTSAPQP